jgi:hypothetical protein
MTSDIPTPWKCRIAECGHVWIPRSRHGIYEDPVRCPRCRRIRPTRASLTAWNAYQRKLRAQRGEK